MLHTRLEVVFCTVGLAAFVVLGDVTANATDNDSLPGREVVLYPIISYSSPESGPEAAAVEGAWAVAEELGSVTVTVPRGSAEKRESALEKLGKTADEKWGRQLERKRRDGAASKTARVYGACGWSEVTLANATGDNIAYAAGRFALNRPGWAYRTNIHVWDTSAYDFSNWDFPDTGSLYGRTTWYDSFTFRVDENGHYGATLNRGDVYAGNDRGGAARICGSDRPTRGR